MKVSRPHLLLALNRCLQWPHLLRKLMKLRPLLVRGLHLQKLPLPFQRKARKKIKLRPLLVRDLCLQKQNRMMIMIRMQKRLRPLLGHNHPNQYQGRIVAVRSKPSLQ